MAIYTIINKNVKNPKAEVYGSLVALLDENKQITLSRFDMTYRFKVNGNYTVIDGFEIYKTEKIKRSKKKGVNLLIED